MNNFKRIIAALLFIVLFIGISDLLFNDRGKTVSSPLDENYDFQLLERVFMKIQESYVEEIDENDIIKHAINQILGKLDPYTVFYDSKQMKQLETITTGEYGGVGFYLSKVDDDFVFISALEGSPARNSGIRPGDILLKINNVDVDGHSLEEVTDMIKGREKTTVALSVKRNGNGNSLVFNVTREIIHLSDVPYMKKLSNGIGYIKLSHFSRNAAIELINAIHELSKTPLKGLIIDVRGNPGGLLTSAINVVDLFIGKGELIVSTKGREDKFNTEHKSRKDPVYGDKPLIIIVDNTTASASEILAGAIQDLDRGVILGEKTFGKGLVQTIFNPTRNTALKMTTAWYYTPSGRCIDKTKYEWHNKKEDDHQKYYTKSGRVVYGNGGIIPDIAVDSKDEIETVFYEKSFFLKFAINYARKNLNSENVYINDEILNQFKEFVLNNGYEKTDSGIKELNELQEIGKKNKYGSEFASSIETMKKKITADVRNNFSFNKEVMGYHLAREMNWVLGGEKARIEAVFDNDIFLNEAVDILVHSEKYKQILGTEILN